MLRHGVRKEETRYRGLKPPQLRSCRWHGFRVRKEETRYRGLKHSAFLPDFFQYFSVRKEETRYRGLKHLFLWLVAKIYHLL